MTQSKPTVTSSPEKAENTTKKKRSYIAKLFGRRKKSKERKEEKRRLALSASGSDENGCAKPLEGGKNKNKKKPKKNLDKVKTDSSSDSDAKKGNGGLFKRRGAKKKSELTSVSVALSDPTAIVPPPPDLISHEVNGTSTTTKHGPEGKKQSPAGNNRNDSNNNIDSTKKITDEVIMKITNKNAKVLTPRDLHRDCRRPDAFQYDSATVGRRPVRRKNTNGSDNPNNFRRTRSFSGNAPVSNFPRSRAKQNPVGQNSEGMSATKYANMCRQSNQAFDSFAKGAKASDKDCNFLRWHSVGDIHRHMTRERPAEMEGNVSSKMKRKNCKKEQKSVSLQDLTFKDVCGESEKASPSVYEKISKKCARTKQAGQLAEEILRRPIDPHVRLTQKPRPSLMKALSKSEANIWTAKEESRNATRSILAFKKVCLPENCQPQKRHSADALEPQSTFVYPTYKASNHPEKTGNGSFYYNMTSDALLGHHSGTNGERRENEILYNHITPNQSSTSPHQHNSSNMSRSGNESLLRSSTSTGALLGIGSDESGVSWAVTPSVKKSVYEQRAHLPDYSQDVEMLLGKLRSSLREIPPPLPPKSSRLNGEVSYWADDVSGQRNANSYPPFLRPRYDVNFNTQFRTVSSSPHRALPVSSHVEGRGAGVSRSRSRARSIAKRFNFSGSVENLSSTPLAVCTTGNWSTELDVPEGYCRMKPLVAPVKSDKPVPENPHAVKMRHCPIPDHTVDRNATLHSSSGVKMRSKPYNTHSYTTSKGYPEVGETFYYGRRPVSTSYADRAPNEFSFPANVRTNTSGNQPSLSPNELVKRPKVFYALDV